MRVELVEKIVEDAIKIEIDILKRNIGKQDHYAACYGGFNDILFKKDSSTNISPIKISKIKLNLIFKKLLFCFLASRLEMQAQY